jgi:hypothetical protein
MRPCVQKDGDKENDTKVHHIPLNTSDKVLKIQKIKTYSLERNRSMAADNANQKMVECLQNAEMKDWWSGSSGRTSV